MEASDLDRLTELEQAATDGKWHVGTPDLNRDQFILYTPRGRYGAWPVARLTDDDDIGDPEPEGKSRANADLIVALRNHAPDLIAATRERDQLRALLAEVRLIAGPEDKTGRALLHILDGDR
jgi:hypothetical protein